MRNAMIPVCLAVLVGSLARGAVPLNDLGNGLYLNQFQGGLYPNGSNDAPAPHAATGLSRASAIQPLNPAGLPDPQGKFVFLSVGMSNTSQEFGGTTGNPTQGTPFSFMGQAATHPAVNRSSMVIYNGARGAEPAENWTSPTSVNYDRIRTGLTSRGLSEAQVRVAWLKQANPGPNTSLPSANADAWTLLQHTGNIVRAMKQRYPNLETVLVSSRIFAGYASTGLNPEPYAYESGISVKRLVEAQINQMNGGPTDPIAGNLDHNSVAPWLAWGPYLWADGMNPRSDGLTWSPGDFASDGTHPSDSGQQKVGRLLLQNLLTSPFAQPWFLSTVPGDANIDGTVNLEDFNALAANFGQSNRTWTTGDFNYDGLTNLADFNILATHFGVSAAGTDVTPQDWANLASAIPEPGNAVLLWLGTGCLLRRRRTA
jgi:hypothetical protein